jgi:hypothetical protein
MDVSLKNNTRLQNFTKPTKHKEDFNFTHKNFFIKSSKSSKIKIEEKGALLTGFGQPIFGEGKGNLEPGLERLRFRHW